MSLPDPLLRLIEALQRLPGVKDTFTIIAFKAFSPDTTV